MTLCKRHERHIFATSEVRSRGEMGPWDVVGVDCTMRTITLFYVKSSLSVSMMGTDIIWFHIWCMYIYIRCLIGEGKNNNETQDTCNKMGLRWQGFWPGCQQAWTDSDVSDGGKDQQGQDSRVSKNYHFISFQLSCSEQKKTCQVNKLPWNNGRKILIHPIMNEIPSMDVANLRW